jgi:PAS domain S-box-containing protein
VTILETTATQLDDDLLAVLGRQFSASPHPMWVFDQTSLAFLAVNDAALRQYGYSRAEFLSMTILDIRPPEDIPQVLCNALRPHTATGQPERWRHRTKSGEIVEVEVVGVSVIFDNRLAQLVTVYPRRRAASVN